MSEEVGEGCVLHATRAVELMAQQQWKLAIEDLDRALASNLPERARDELARLQQSCRDALDKKPS
jgi:hypothetical protein